MATIAKTNARGFDGDREYCRRKTTYLRRRSPLCYECYTDWGVL